jgi:hypothetical protein
LDSDRIRKEVSVTNGSFATFAEMVWHKLGEQPLGSLTKRELELTLLRAALDSDLIEPHAENLAATCNIPISRAHGYLTDIALRKPPMTDVDAVKSLVELLKDAEVVRDDSHFSIPLQDAALRIWLERKMALLRLNSGDTLRRDHVKLTPAGLAKIIGASGGIVSPYDALKKLPLELAESEWAKSAKKSWKKGMGWSEAIRLTGNAVSVLQAINHLGESVIA